MHCVRPVEVKVASSVLLKTRLIRDIACMGRDVLSLCRTAVTQTGGPVYKVFFGDKHTMKKLLTIFAILGLACTHQAQASLADQINENQTDWLLGAWEADIDGNTISLSYKWVVKDHVIASHLKTNDNETYSLIGLNPESGEIEQTGYDIKGKKSTGKWGPKGDMPMVTVKSTSDTGETQSMAVAFRRIDENNIEAQIFEVDASGNVGDFSSISFEMKRKKEKK